MAYVYQRWLARELRAEGLKVVEIEGWENRGRPASTGSFDPQGPSTTHHTGGTDVQGMLRLLVQGRSDLPGPLCQVATGPDGTVYVIAAGRANHAGRVGKSGQKGMPYGADGNALSIGNEVITNGTSPLPAAQRAAIAGVNRVIARHFGKDASWAHRHADISGTGKWDIGQLTTAELRSDMGSLSVNEEDNMAVEDIVRAFFKHEIPYAKGKTAPFQLVQRWTLNTAGRAQAAAQAALAQSRKNRDAIAALAEGQEERVREAVLSALGDEVQVTYKVELVKEEEA